MLRPFLLTCIILSSTTSQAQYTSLSSKDIDRIKTMPGKASDSNYGYPHFLTYLKQQADSTLTQDPHPIDTLRSQGLLMGDPRKTATWNAIRDMPKMYVLALQFRLDHNKKYLHKAAAYLTAWATRNNPDGDPINDTNLDGAIEAYDLLKEYLPKIDNQLIRNWLSRTASAEILSNWNKPASFTSWNNWNSHRIKILGEIAYAIDDTTLQAYAIAGLKKQVEKNLNPDGTSIDFTQRDALHYQIYDIDPLIRLCIVIYRATGVDYYSWLSPKGCSVKRSVEWVVPFLDGTKTHAEFVNSKEKFDRDRAKNNEAAYQPGRLFDPTEGAQTLMLASYFDTTLGGKAQTLYHNAKTHPSPMLFALTQ